MSTKDKILDVAEILFADKGFVSVSVRDIVNEAGVNISAISYHFGSKEDLIFAVMKRRIDLVNSQRLKALSQLRRQYPEDIIPLRELLEAFVKPVFAFGKENKQQGSKFMQLMGRVMANTNPEMRERVINLFTDIIKEFLPEIAKSCPNIPLSTIAYRFYFSVGSMAHTLMNQELPAELSSKMSAENKNLVDLDITEKELIDFLLGGISVDA